MPTAFGPRLTFHAQRVALVRLRKPDEHPWAIDAAFDALEAWLAAAGSSVVYRVWQRRRAPAPATYLGRGKALQLRALCDLGGVETVVLDGTPTAAQRANLQVLLGRPVADRSVWAPSVVMSPAVSRTRTLHRGARRGRGIRNVVLVGCVGAGKSTLFGAITRAPRCAPSWPAPQGPGPAVVTRRLRGGAGDCLVLVTDTPGLVWNPERGSWIVPAETRVELRDADVILHVIDGEHPDARRRARQVALLLDAFECRAAVLPVWTQVDKAVDLVRDDGTVQGVSGRTGQGCGELVARLQRLDNGASHPASIDAGCGPAPKRL